MILKMNMKMKGWSMNDKENLLILTQTGEANLLTLIGEADFLILIMVGKEDTQVLMSII